MCDESIGKPQWRKRNEDPPPHPVSKIPWAQKGTKLGGGGEFRGPIVAWPFTNYTKTPNKEIKKSIEKTKNRSRGEKEKD